MSSSNVQIEVAAAKHRSGILYLIETVFSKFEPVEVALDYPWEKVKDGWEKTIDQLLAHPHSHVAVDENGAVVGFRLSRVIDLDTFSDSSIYEWLEPGILKDVSDEITAGWRRTFEEVKCKRLLQFTCLCTTPECGRKGLAKEMSLKNLALGKQFGCTHSSVIATNLYSQKAFEAVGFRELRGIRYEELKKDQNGKPPFVITDPVQKMVKWYIREL